MRSTFDDKDRKIDELLQQSKDLTSANKLLRHDLDYITEQMSEFAATNETLKAENASLVKQVQRLSE